MKLLFPFVLLATLFLEGAGSAATADIAAGEPTVISAPIRSDTAWEGRVAIAGMITVESGATLTIRPGTEVRFSVEGGLTVHGVLRAEGVPEKPILFLPAAESQEPWAGIVMTNGAAPSQLRSCRIARAKVVGLAAGEHRVEACEITGGVVGISVAGDQARAVISGNRLADLSAGGIHCTANAAPVVTDNLVERCGPRGISADQGALPQIRGNRISDCESGIELNQTAARVSGNTISGCARGIALTAVSGGEPIRGNRLERNQTGIRCQQFSDPEISGNTILKNGEGIICFMGAKPFILNNDILDNETGIICTQLSSPEVRANTIAGNRKGVVLHLSSYALVNANNITGNDTQMELMNMSSDWERRAGPKKPARGLQQKNRGLVERGRALPDAGIGDGAEIGGAADATGNWWGEATTREMEEKGPGGNITGLIDYFDVPTRTYEGFEGEYIQDRISYAPWVKERIATAGVPAPAAPAGK